MKLACHLSIPSVPANFPTLAQALQLPHAFKIQTAGKQIAMAQLFLRCCMHRPAVSRFGWHACTLQRLVQHLILHLILRLILRMVLRLGCSAHRDAVLVVVKRELPASPQKACRERRPPCEADHHLRRWALGGLTVPSTDRRSELRCCRA